MDELHGYDLKSSGRCDWKMIDWDVGPVTAGYLLYRKSTQQTAKHAPRVAPSCSRIFGYSFGACLDAR